MKKLLWLFSLAVIITACQSGPQTVAEYEEAGKKAFFKEDYESARQYLGKAVAMKSSDRDILYFLGISYQREYMLDSALFFLKRADLLYPKDRELNVAIYPIAAELKEWEMAARAIAVLIQTGDDIENYRERLADLNVKMENYGVAYIHAKRLLELQPENPDRYYQLSVLASELDSFDIAISLIDQAIEKFGSNEKFLSNKGMFHAEKGEYDTAERILRPLAESDSAKPVNIYNLARTLSLQDSRAKKSEAYDLFQQAATQMPVDYTMDSIMTMLKYELYPESLPDSLRAFLDSMQAMNAQN